MKKLISFVMMLLVMAAVNPFDSYAQASKDAVKSAKARAKELKKEKWYCEDNKTIEAALIEIAGKEASGYRVLIGSAYNVDDQNDAASDAWDDAFQKMGELGKNIITGRVASNRKKRNGNTSRNSEAAYDRHLMRELEGLMDTPYLTLYRDKNGKFDCREYFVVQTSMIEKAVERAEDSAAKEMENAKQYGDGVSDFINGGAK
ncbi:MAG: hypothetical protein HDR83_07425 [Bacteroides sp.]|nr:hypothetical protein [Bacteroidales bacterium]MBD5369074.1 hypothetical protein [Bacteroides sp.]